jgi:hypothetical protein
VEPDDLADGVLTDRPLLSFGYSSASWLAMVTRLARTWATVTPGFSRPTTPQSNARRSSKFSSANPLSTWRYVIEGSQATGRANTLRPLKRGGATPMMVNA